MRQASPQDLVVEVVHQHADVLLRIARRYSECADDAQDAYQRALEIFVRRAHRLEPAKAHQWLAVVVRNEAIAVRRQRAQLVGVASEGDFDVLDDGRAVASIEEHTEHVDEIGRAAEALRGLKPQEVTALWLKAQGLTYKEIAERQGWTYTKTNRALTEGRRSFLQRLHGIESGAECERWVPMLSAMADGEASAEDVAEVRPHLRNCAACRASLAEMRHTPAKVAALLPPVVLGGGLPSRLGELAAWCQERVVGTVTRVQAVAEAAGAGKAAAVVASTAALAGGGVAVERGLHDDAGAASPAAPVASQQAAAPPPAPAAVVPAGSAGHTFAPVASPARKNRRTSPPDAAFAPEATTHVRQRPAVTSSPPDPPRTTDVFGFEGG